MYAVPDHAYVEVEQTPLEKHGLLLHHVRFSGDDKIFETTTRIYPGEVPAVERVYDFPGDDVVVHVGLQVRLKRRRFFPEHQQTTTRYIVKPPPDRAA